MLWPRVWWGWFLVPVVLPFAMVFSMGYLFLRALDLAFIEPGERFTNHMSLRGLWRHSPRRA